MVICLGVVVGIYFFPSLRYPGTAFQSLVIRLKILGLLVDTLKLPLGNFHH